MIQCSAVSSPNPGPAGGDIPCRSTIFNVAFALRVSRIITGDFVIKDFPLAEYQRFYKGRTTGIRRVAGAGCRDLQCTGVPCIATGGKSAAIRRKSLAETEIRLDRFYPFDNPD